MNENKFSARADPDALLAAINSKKKKTRGGRLYLFFGMAPGVGKTYAMLLAAQEAKKSGANLAIGVVETHGRIETQSLADGIEIIPKHELEHRGVILKEMDLDAILKRRPSIVLVDELAHTNAPGSRHTKRWQDVFELLDAGIDVYSTLNVQHLESRKDAVLQIANVSVRETVPDILLDRAHQIQLVDISVPDLLKRLKEGKIYLGDRADIAAQNFFKEDKLTALREIALRVTAEKVDNDLKSFTTERESGSSWPTSERLMVAVAPHHQSEILIRATRKMAYNLEAPWIAINVSNNAFMSEQEQATLQKNLNLARNLGAEILTITDTNVVEALIRTAVQRDVSQIVVGRSSPNWLKKITHGGTTLEKLIKYSNISLCIVGDEPPLKSAKFFDVFSYLEQHTSWESYAKALAFTLLITAVNSLLASWIGYRAVGFFFLLGVLILGLSLPIGPILIVSVLTALIWDFFFVPSVGTFSIREPEDFFMCISYVVAALATGVLTRRIKYHQEILFEREARSQILRQIVADLSFNTAKQMISSTTKRIGIFLGGASDVVLAKKDGSLGLFSEQSLELSNEKSGMAVAKWALDNNKIAGLFTDTLASADALYIPLKASTSTVGVLAFQAKKRSALSGEDMDFLALAAKILATFIEKEQLRKSSLKTERLAESEKLHQSLLKLMAEEAKSGNKANIDNFLLASRLSIGIYPLNKEAIDPHQLVIEAQQRITNLLREHTVSIKAPSHLPLIYVDQQLLFQAFANVLLNSTLSSPSGTPINIEIESNRYYIKFIIRDHGAHLPQAELGRLFDRKNDKSGLALAIAKGIIRAHGGKISAANHPDGGLIVSFEIPLPKQTSPD